MPTEMIITVLVSRRTGGLENTYNNMYHLFSVSRRTGGLEMRGVARIALLVVSRRTGGLENF